MVAEPLIRRLFLLHPAYPTILLELTNTTDTIVTSAGASCKTHQYKTCLFFFSRPFKYKLVSSAGSELLGEPEGRHLHHRVLQARARLGARRSDSQEHDHEGGHRPGEGGATGRVARQAQRLRDQQVLQAFVLQTAGEKNEAPAWCVLGGIFLLLNRASLFAVMNHRRKELHHQLKGEAVGSCEDVRIVV